MQKHMDIHHKLLLHELKQMTSTSPREFPTTEILRDFVHDEEPIATRLRSNKANQNCMEG